MKRLAALAATVLILNPGWSPAGGSSKSSSGKSTKAVKDQINLDLKLLRDEVKKLRGLEQDAVDRVYAAYDATLAAKDVPAQKRKEEADALRKERAAQLEKIDARHRESLAKKAEAVAQAKSQRDKLAAQKQAELAEAADCKVTLEVVRTTFNPQIEAQDAKLRVAERDLAKLEKEIAAEKAKVQSVIDPKIEDLEKTETQIRREIAAIVRQRNAEARKVRAPFTSKIAALELQIQNLESAKPTRK